MQFLLHRYIKMVQRVAPYVSTFVERAKIIHVFFFFCYDQNKKNKSHEKIVWLRYNAYFF